jgi:TolB protein
MNRLVLSFASLACLAGQVTAQATPPQPAQHGATPTVSPDGQQIAFRSDRTGTVELYIINADGSGVRQLTNGGHTGRAYWSPDGRRVTFTTSTSDTAHLFSMATDGGVPTELARFAARGGAVLGPDGSRVLYGVGSWTDVQLVTSRLDGTGRLPLTADGAAYWCPAWSPKGDEVAATRNDSAGMQISIIRTDGSGAHALTHFTKAEGGPQCPVFSSDGRRIAVQSEAADPQDPKKSNSYIWVVDVATGHATRLGDHAAPCHDELPAWFPDGNRIAFQSDRTGRWEVWVMNADGTGARQLTR